MEASGLWVDPVLKNMWEDLKCLIQFVVNFRELTKEGEKKRKEKTIP